MYTPILRNRQSEMLALQGVPGDAKEVCLPVIDVAAPGTPKKVEDLRAYISKNAVRTAKAVAGCPLLMIDSSELDPSFKIGQKHPLTYLSEAISAAGVKVIPVTGLHRDDSHNAAALECLGKSNSGICFRLDNSDVATASLTYAKLKKTISEWKIQPNQVGLILDFQSVYGESDGNVAAAANSFLTTASITPWKFIVMAGYGLPDQISTAIAVREQGYVPRVEREAFRKALANTKLKNLWFGDYATVPPTQMEMDWRIVSKVMSPKAIYALDDSWFIVRGGPFSSHAKGFKQYFDIAAEITALQEFSGSDYSPGDEYISECSAQSCPSGSPASWIKACANHHITLTSRLHA